MWWSVVAMTVVAVVTMCEGHSLRFQSEKLKFDMLSDEEINYINSIQTTWKADRNFDTSHTKSVLNLLGTRQLPEKDHTLPVISGSMGLELPENFDPRTKWPFCKSLSEIRDQGNCASGWAVAAVGAMTDRVCIHYNGSLSPHLSSEDLMACCTTCGTGCTGGYPYYAWYYWVNSGIVTGGPYGSKQGCQPYQLPPCEHHVTGSLPPCQSKSQATPLCYQKCEPGYNKTYLQDRVKGKWTYRMSDMTVMMEQLYTRGPIEANMQVYSDFFSYKSGIYQQTTGSFLGLHSVRILGWGVEKGVNYWLAANSWNSQWGDSGFFKIVQGQNECGIEDSVVAGTPL